MAFRRDFEKSNYSIKELGAGAYGNVYASIPRDMADKIVSDLQKHANPSDPVHTATAKTQIRAAMQAAKISKGGSSFRRKNDSKREIETMRILNVGNYPNVVRMITADPSYGWLTLEMLMGRDLLEFRKIRDTRPFPPVPLAWHFVHDLASALLAMHERGYAHMDIAERNIMLRPSGAYRDYPDVVIIDLGQVYNLEALQNDWRRNIRLDTKGLLELQMRDLNALHFPLNFIFNQVARSNAALHNALESIKAYRSHRGDRADEFYVNFLTKLRDTASRSREESYEPLPANIVAYFEGHEKIVSDEDLEKVFPELS